MSKCKGCDSKETPTHSIDEDGERLCVLCYFEATPLTESDLDDLDSYFVMYEGVGN